MEEYRTDGGNNDYRQHNIFDMNTVPPYPHQHAHHHHSHSQDGGNNANNFSFNSTLPALNPRYDAEAVYQAQQQHNAPSPSSVDLSLSGGARSRSHSREQQQGGWDNRPPSSSGGAGPIRTNARSRRERNSFSSTSPPPAFRSSRTGGNPGAIAIPHRPPSSIGGGGTPISPIGMHSLSTSTDASSYGLPPTPGLPSSAQDFGNGGSPFAHQPSPPDHHGFNSYLPPLHEHQPHHVTKGFHNMPYQHQGGYGQISSSLPHHHTSYPSHPFSGGVPANLQGIPQQQPSPPLSISSSLPQTSSVQPPNAKSSGSKKEDKAAILASEKKRRRRESHNAVERRRRDNINEKISELATLIPECMLDGTVDPSQTPAPSDNVVPAVNGESPPEETVEDQTPNPVGLLNTFNLGPLEALPENSPTSPTSPIIPTGPPPSANGAGPASPNGDTQVVKANKGMILRKSVDYIRYLQQLVSVQGARNRELEAELRAVRGGGSSGSSSAFAMNTMGLGMGMGMMSPILTQSSPTPKELGTGTTSQTSTITPNNVVTNGAGDVKMLEGLSPLSSASEADENGNGVKMEDEDGVERGRPLERKVNGTLVGEMEGVE